MSMKKVKLTEAEFKVEKDTGKLTLREALSQDAGLPIAADPTKQIGARYDGPPDAELGLPWGSSLWSHNLQTAGADTELHLTEDEATALDANHKTDVKANILAKVKATASVLLVVDGDGKQVVDGEGNPVEATVP